jgi:hypothetical protein
VLTSFVNSLATHTGPICAATSGATNGTTISVTPTPTNSNIGGGSSSGIVSTTSPSTDLAAKPTGMLAGAAAAAGLLGAIALL